MRPIGAQRVDESVGPTSEKRVLFIDTVAISPYSDRSLRASGLGGTEATVVQVATRLAADRPVTVAQRARERPAVSAAGIELAPYRHCRHESLADVGTVIVVRAHKLLPRLRRSYPDARMILWMHCFPGRRLRSLARTAAATRTTVVGVSRHHKEAMQRFFDRHDPVAAAAAHFDFVYNPISDELSPDSTPTDRDKLIFISSPHKGLEQVLDAFHWVRRRIPSLRLFVANPGYLRRSLREGDGVVPLGVLPHREVIHQLRSALCLFYPQTTFAETFGLVFAEANAVGTPVLAHPLGATPEVVGDPDQVFDVSDRDAILERLLRWRDGGRPRPTAPSHLRLSRVVDSWRDLLDRRAVAHG